MPALVVTADRVETQVASSQIQIPAQGEVRGLMISDAQWGRMIIMRSQQTADAEENARTDAILLKRRSA